MAKTNKNSKKNDKTLREKNVEKVSKTNKNTKYKTRTKAEKPSNDAVADAELLGAGMKKPRRIKFLGGLLLSKMARGGAAALRQKANEVNELNVFPVPDGDTGDNMSLTIESGVAAIERLETDNLADAMKVFSHGMLLGARGNSGVILSQFFAGVASGLDGVKRADPKTLGAALECGVKQAYTSVMTPSEGTILTVARESVEYAVSRINSESTIRTLFADLVEEMHASLERTPEILKVLKDAEVVDSGAAGLFYIMDGFNRVLNGKKIKFDKMPSDISPSVSSHLSFNADSDMKYGYCTELLVQLQNRKTDVDKFDIEGLKLFLSEIGDSVVSVKRDSIVKIHVHTFTPEKILEHMRKFGEFISVKIENMSLQHTQTLEAVAHNVKTESKSAPKKKNAVVSVSIGDGIKTLFLELGAEVVIEGGQTNNPSTCDFLDAFDRLNAENIFVLPNNSNVIMAAEQAGNIYKKAKVYVSPSKNIGMGYAALSSVDINSSDADTARIYMTEAMKKAKTAYLSVAVRDTEINGINIRLGDIIGIMDKEIVVAEQNLHSAALLLSKKLLFEGNRRVLTVFFGKGVDGVQNEVLRKDLSEEIKDLEIYFINGGQEIYPYIFLAE